MEQDIEKLLELAEENNKLLRRLVNDLRWRRLFSLIKWALIIGVALGTFYYLEPYLKVIVELYQKIYGVSTGQSLDLKSVLGGFQR